VPIGFGTDLRYFLMVIMPRVYLYENRDANNEKLSKRTIVLLKILEMDQKNRQLRTGLFADIVATNDDPTENVNTVTNVVFVMKEESFIKH
jgi:hypothetical protein